MPKSDRITLKTVPQPASGVRVIVMQFPIGAAFTGHDDYPDACCGSCGQPLTHGVDVSRLEPVVIQCRCGAFNNIPWFDADSATNCVDAGGER